MTMVTARNCTETRFNQLWDALHEKAVRKTNPCFSKNCIAAAVNVSEVNWPGDSPVPGKPYSMPSVKVGSSAHFWTRLSTRRVSANGRLKS